MKEALRLWLDMMGAVYVLVYVIPDTIKLLTGG